MAQHLSRKRESYTYGKSHILTIALHSYCMWRVCRRTLGKKLIDLTLATLGLKKSPKLVSNLRKDTEKQPYI